MDALMDELPLPGGVTSGIGWMVDVAPGCTNTALGVERIARLLVGLIAGVGVTDHLASPFAATAALVRRTGAAVIGLAFADAVPLA